MTALFVLGRLAQVMTCGEVGRVQLRLIVKELYACALTLTPQRVVVYKYI